MLSLLMSVYVYMTDDGALAYDDALPVSMYQWLQFFVGCHVGPFNVCGCQWGL